MMKVVATNFSLALHILFCKRVCCFFVNSFSSVNNFRSWLEEEEGERGVVEKKKLKREKAKAGLRKKRGELRQSATFLIVTSSSPTSLLLRWTRNTNRLCWPVVGFPFPASSVATKWSWEMGRQSWQHWICFLACILWK